MQPFSITGRSPGLARNQAVMLALSGSFGGPKRVLEALRQPPRYP